MIMCSVIGIAYSYEPTMNYHPAQILWCVYDINSALLLN